MGGTRRVLAGLHILKEQTPHRREEMDSPCSEDPIYNFRQSNVPKSLVLLSDRKIRSLSQCLEVDPMQLLSRAHEALRHPDRLLNTREVK